jgi:hypothetical protein
MHDMKGDEIVVTVDHPHGRVEMPLSEWMKTGPGERLYVRPVAARNCRTGHEVPISAIPLPFRNTALSRSLISLGLLSNPWKR